ncbi:hypothetical protein BGZ65_002964 [Modicella reniformis]|uniref:PIN domain-containing protein n=1 Tax=Modicella reniformis TaxID=1440133 RepID=A0A9P6M044_9FUNG|nr:hypothetical protein BGZ65_002964 [Modicella reniformis]
MCNTSLKDIYETALLEDLTAAVEQSADERLWRHVFYTPIEELRAELRKLDKDSERREEVMNELCKLLDKGNGFYHEMITTLRCEHEINLSTVAVDVLHADPVANKSRQTPVVETKSSQSRSRNGKTRQQSRSKEEASAPTYTTEALASCIQKCLIYLGDLARYRINIRLETGTMLAAAQPTVAAGQMVPQAKPFASEWHVAYQFYKRAIQTFPDSGKPYGQLAILATYANDDLDALYWYTLSLGAKCPSSIVRDNLKVFFSRYQNRYKDLLSSICPPVENPGDSVSTDEDTNTPVRTLPSEKIALEKCDLTVLFVKILMDLFLPQYTNHFTTFKPNSSVLSDPNMLKELCQKLAAKLTTGGYDVMAHKTVASVILVMHDLHARTNLSSFSAESTTKGGAMGLKQAQRAGLVYVLSMITVLLDHQLSMLHPEDSSDSHLNQELLSALHLLIEFWISHWDQVWGMIRLEEKWVGVSSVADFSLRKATTTFFRSFVTLINVVCPKDQEYPNSDDISQKALCLLQQDRGHLYGLLPFRRFHNQLTVNYDVVEDSRVTKLYRMLYFADKVIQASEGIRGTVVELSMEPALDEDRVEATRYRLLDADAKRQLRERGSKMLASHWLQDQVSALQKGLEDTERRSGAHSNHQDGQHGRKENARTRPLVPISTLPGTVKLPLSGQTRLTDHYQRGPPKFNMPGVPHQGRSADRNSSSKSSQSKIRPDKHPPVWTCVVDCSVLIWNLAEIRVLLEHHRCLIIVPLDVIDRLDQAKKGQEKENQKARDAIRFLDARLNITRWGMSEPLLVGQSDKDSLSRWSEAIPFLVEESVASSTGKSIRRAAGSRTHGVEHDGDVVMDERQSSTNPERESSETEGNTMSEIEDDNNKEEEVEVRNTMNVPRIWRPILGACLFMLRKREEANRIPEDRFMLLTEDPDLLHYARWFNIPASSTHSWKHNGL